MEGEELKKALEHDQVRRETEKKPDDSNVVQLEYPGGDMMDIPFNTLIANLEQKNGAMAKTLVLEFLALARTFAERSASCEKLEQSAKNLELAEAAVRHAKFSDETANAIIAMVPVSPMETGKPNK